MFFLVNVSSVKCTTGTYRCYQMSKMWRFYENQMNSYLSALKIVLLGHICWLSLSQGDSGQRFWPAIDVRTLLPSNKNLYFQFYCLIAELILCYWIIRSHCTTNKCLYMRYAWTCILTKKYFLLRVLVLWPQD